MVLLLREDPEPSQLVVRSWQHLVRLEELRSWYKHGRLRRMLLRELGHAEVVEVALLLLPHELSVLSPAQPIAAAVEAYYSCATCFDQD